MELKCGASKSMNRITQKLDWSSFHVINDGVFSLHNISAAYSELSSSMPTTDVEIDLEREPASLNPDAPAIYPRQKSHDVDPFASLAMKVV